MSITVENFLETAFMEARRSASPRLFSILHKLVSGFSVKANDEISSASIAFKGANLYEIQVSPSFLRKYVNSPQDALHLLLHEVIHKIRGDIYMTFLENKLNPKVVNLALDIFVDALQMRICFPEGAPYLLLLYPPDRFPHNLLLPPPQLFRAWSKKIGSAGEFGMPYESLMGKIQSDEKSQMRMRFTLESIFRECNCERPSKAAELYSLGWLGDATFRNYLDQFSEIVNENIPWIIKFIDLLTFLGDHIFNTLQNDLGLGKNETGAFYLGAGYSAKVQEDRITPLGQVQCYEFFEAVRKALGPSTGCTRKVLRFGTERGMVAFPGRRETFFIAAGYTPVFYPNSVHTLDEKEEQAQLYIDVSGSTDSIQPFLYGLALHLHEGISEPVHLFSNAVEDVMISDLAKGVRKSTLGTDFDCIFEHALKHNFKKILIVTDGYATLSNELAEKAQKQGMKVFVVYTSDGSKMFKQNLDAIAQETWILPDIVK
ncbi:MAG: VWA domain-containing protein [Deltaproteobacteria bacterium]|nr:VWA domain-containing protein [Deltaproteobacteria bacterium]